MRSALLSLVFLVLITGIARGVEVAPNDTIEAPLDFSPIPAEGNDTVYEQWMELCKEDDKCSELYGLSETTNLQQFIHLITLVSPFPGDPLYLENALVYNIYGKTLQEIENQTLVNQMKIGILCSNSACGINEKPTVKNGTVKCDPRPGRSPSDRNVEDIIIKILIAAGSLLLIVYVTKTGYSFSKDSWKASVQAYIQLRQPPKKTGPAASPTTTSPTNTVISGMHAAPTHSSYPTGLPSHSQRQRISHRAVGRGVRPPARTQRNNVWS